MNREWRAISWAHNYEVSNFGEVRSAYHGKKKKILKQSVTNTGGYIIALYDDSGVKHTCTVARLIAEAFIPNPDNLPIVLHANLDPSDNRVDNLKWSNRSEVNETKRKGAKTGNYSRSSIKILCVETGVIYNSIHACARNMNISVEWLRTQLKKSDALCKGFHFVKVS